MSSATKSSGVWKYFRKNDTRNVCCNLCGKNYKTSGNTTNLATHLKNKHFHAYNKLNPTGKKKTEKISTKSCEIENNKVGESSHLSEVGQVRICI